MPDYSISAKHAGLRWIAMGLMILGGLGGGYGALEYTRWQPGTEDVCTCVPPGEFRGHPSIASTAIRAGFAAHGLAIVPGGPV